jgi:hypothetical protein
MNSYPTTIPTAAQISSSSSSSRSSDPRPPVPDLSAARGGSLPARPSTSAVALEDFRSLVRLALDKGVSSDELASLIAGDAS